jgi:hypothetical protein
MVKQVGQLSENAKTTSKTPFGSATFVFAFGLCQDRLNPMLFCRAAENEREE